MRFSKTILLSFFTLGVVACASETIVENELPLKEQMANLDKETKVLIGLANCSSDSQCHSMGFGHKPCGGFYKYRIYSDENTNTDQLENKINQYNSLSREFNKKNNIISNCMLLIKPVLICHNNSCQTNLNKQE